MWELDHKEGWIPNNWCFWTVVLKKILESPLDCKEIKLVNPEENQSWMFIGRTDAEAETPILTGRASSLEKTQMLGKMTGRRRGGQQRMRQLDGIMTQWIRVWANSGRQWRTGKPDVLQFMVSQRVGHDLETDQQQGIVIYNTINKIITSQVGQQ